MRSSVYHIFQIAVLTRLMYKNVRKTYDWRKLLATSRKLVYIWRHLIIKVSCRAWWPLSFQNTWLPVISHCKLMTRWRERAYRLVDFKLPWQIVSQVCNYSIYLHLNNLIQWRSQNAEKVAYIRDRQLYQAVIVYSNVPLKNVNCSKRKEIAPRGSEFFSLRAVP